MWEHAYCACHILEAMQLDTGSLAHLIATKMGSCKLVLELRYNLRSYVSNDTYKRCANLAY